MNPFHFLLGLIRAIILIVTLTFWIFGYLFFSLWLFKNTNERAFRLRRAWVLFAIKVCGIKFEAEGKIHHESALYVCNHRSFCDPLILIKYLDAYVIAKAEVSGYPLIHTGAKLTGVIYVKRDNKDSRLAVRKAYVDTIKSGQNVLVYPEGTTNPFKTLLEYRPGTFLEAARHGFPIVPVVLEYKDQKDIWFNRGLFSQFFRQFGRWRTYAKLSIGPVFEGTDGIELRDQVQEWSQDKVNQMHKGWNSVFSD
ncbi:MAG: 1-acyl-sn-glycerol-3-phosphate acyltransferase [Saprospiraceae bacterium]|nr:1-acyl-sn-glycerol-3-phosphate acyltransferase [Bacteroidia bacterium]NNF21119.1 1-acyl-sn-glycerol-3-phosphate acyltransferase [Saprospiraceae bacterium]